MIKQKIALFYLTLGFTIFSVSLLHNLPVNSHKGFINYVLKVTQNKASDSVNYFPFGFNNFVSKFSEKNLKNCQPIHTKPNFLVIGGGGDRSYNEIALEKNVLYFQRTLKTMGYDPSLATIFFANGNNGEATIRYLDKQGIERFKVPKINNLKGAATSINLENSLKNLASQAAKSPLFFYFTGHGIINKKNTDNNAFILWKEELVTVRQFSNLLDKTPANNPVVVVMAQCFSGSFANFIYQGGIPTKPLALQTRCGFFATVSTLPSVGCTPEVNEADYRDYSSSFFAGLSGVNRIGKPVANADYNHDGRISYTEAHAFAKVDEKSPDLPVSTSEVWLQKQASESELEKILRQPISKLYNTARPEQKYVINSLSKLFKFNPNQSYWDNFDKLSPSQTDSQEKKSYQIRLAMELINVSVEQKIRASNNASDIAILDKLISCEASSWK